VRAIRAVRAIHPPFHDPHGEPPASCIAVRDEICARPIPAVQEAPGLNAEAAP
jgi:arsenate reductase